MERQVKKHGRVRVWSETFKLHVVRSVLERGLTYQEARSEFNVNGKYTIGKWVRKYRGELSSKTIGTMPQHSPVVQPDADSAGQISQLQQLLQQAELKNTALNTMIDLAETTFNISIRKKSGTKQ